MQLSTLFAFLARLGPYIDQGARVALKIFLAVAVVIFVIHAGMALSHRYPLDYGEAPLVNHARRLIRGQNIYQPTLDEPPYVIANYPPLYIIALAPFVALFGPNFWAGRAISIACALATAFFLSRIAALHAERPHPHKRRVALVTGGLFLAIPYVASWSSLARVDLLALALSTGALYTISREPTPTTWRELLPTALLLIAAAYTRQTYGFAAPLAAFVWLWHQQGRASAFKLAALVGGGGLLLLLLLTLVTQGGFLFHIVTANVNPFEWETVARHWRELRAISPIMLIIAGAYIALGFTPQRPKAWPLLTPYLLGALVGAVTIGKVGSNVNYLLELSAALSLVMGNLLETWHAPTDAAQNHQRTVGIPFRPTSLNGWRPYLHAGLSLLIIVQLGWLMRATLRGPAQGRKAYIQPQTNLEELDQIAQHAEAQILADEYMGMLTLQDRPLYMQPFEITQLANAGMWDQTKLLEEIREQKFSLILIHHFMNWPVYKTRWTPEMLEAVTANYAATRFLADTLVFEPRDTIETAELPLLNENGGQCPDAPWPLPTRSEMGMWWYSRALGLMAEAYENTAPVYAVADGLLTRREVWNDAVAIQHDDPLHPGETIWTFYGGMADAQNQRSFVAEAFPPGVEDIPVQAGELLGYQGRWWEGGTWVHVHFALTPARADGSFPAALVDRADETDEPLPHELKEVGRIDPSPYLGVIHSQYMGQPTWLPVRCQTAAE
ncbi:MAG: hypothetical protein ACLFTI_12635 [Anaerolineales bacterium]